MLSNNPLQKFWDDEFRGREAEAQQFLAANSQPLAELLTFIDFAENLAIAFVEVNFAPNGDALVETLQQHPKCQDIQFVVFNFSDQPELRFLRDELLQQLAAVPRQSGKKLVLIVRGLERAIGVSGDDPPVLQDLNFIRDAYKNSVPHPMLFVLPDYAVTRVAKFAPDFWAWRSGVFQFQTTKRTRDEAMTLLEPKIKSRWYEEPVSLERIETLERLLMEFHPSGKAIVAEHVGTCGDILQQLGVAYLSQDNPIKAQRYLVEALKLAEQRDDLALQARVKRALGEAFREQEQYEKAIDYAQQSLEITQKIGDRNGEAESLSIVGDAYELLDEHEKAIAFYQQSLEITRQIGDRKGEAISLGGIGYGYRSLGKYQWAIDFYQQALEITRQIDWLFGEAALLLGLGNAYYSLGKYQRAIDFYQQALEIRREIDDRKGEASSLNCLGYAYRSLKEYQRAIDFHQQALEIRREISDRQGEAISLSNLGNAYYSICEYQRAIDFHQQSLEIARQIGDRKGEAISLSNLGTVYDSLGEYQRAIDFYQQSLEIIRQIGDRQVETFALQRLGVVYRKNGRILEGFAAGLQAILIRQELDLPLEAMPYPNWLKRTLQFAQRGKVQLVLCFALGIVAFPFALVGLIGLLAWRIVRGWVRRG
jgi:tetratricopeptide (TPR) repeat protein